MSYNEEYSSFRYYNTSTQTYSIRHDSVDENMSIDRSFAGNVTGGDCSELSGSISHKTSSSNTTGLISSNDTGPMSPNTTELLGSHYEIPYTNELNSLPLSETLDIENSAAVQLCNDRLKSRLRKYLTRDDLKKLQREHGLNKYSRTKKNIYADLLSHRCVKDCIDSPSKVLGKRRQNPIESEEWPILITDDERENIISDFIDKTSKESLSFAECSFCGIQTNMNTLKEYDNGSLDLTLLTECGRFLCERYNNPNIRVFKLFHDKYLVCSNCCQSIRRKKFETVPRYSYANGCWIGDVPPELQDLSFLEELCIARVRSTRCTIKLSTGKFSQYGSRGNVCVFPQEPKHLIRVLPPPLNSLYDEIAVIFVNNKDSKVTEDLLRKSPLLVRRHKLVDALYWLKTNNKLYEDIEISYDNLSDYSDDGILKNCPAQNILMNESEGSGYSPNVNNSQPLDKAETSRTDTTTPAVQTCGILDSDDQERSQTLRKLDMIKQLLASKESYVKYPASSSQPLSTYKNSKLYALLWPTLFPYGLGTFEDEVRALKSKGFRILDMKRHVKHLLNLTDKRFQTHMTFPFVKPKRQSASSKRRFEATDGKCLKHVNECS